MKGLAKGTGGAWRDKWKSRYVIWLLLLLTFTWILPSACVRAETGQIIAKDRNKSAIQTLVETDLQSEITQTDTVQNLLDDLELTQMQQDVG